MSESQKQASLELVQSWRNNFSSAAEISAQHIPDKYDLRDVGGVDYMGRQLNQGSCASCYTIAFVYLVENRLKLQNEFTDSISPQFLLDCNYLTEGCSGGWAINHGFFAEIGGLMPESCASYKASTYDSKCYEHSSCSPVARVTGSHYMKDITVEKIQQEILYNGAVQTSWNPPYYFNSYVSGLLEPSVAFA